MHWQDAIRQSKKGTAKRILFEKDGIRKTIIRYDDGSGYVVTAKNGSVDFGLSREADWTEMDGYGDWEPTE